MADLLTGGGVDGGGAVVAGEGVLGGEPRHVTDLGQQASSDHRADAKQPGQPGPRRGNQGGDLAAEVFEPGVQGADAGEVVPGDVHPDHRHVAGGADAGQQRLGLVRGQFAAHPAGGQLGQQPVQSAHRLGALRDEFRAPVTPQPQAHRGIVTGHGKDPGTVQGRQAGRDRVVFAGLAPLPAGIHPDPGSQLRRHIQHLSLIHI